MISEDEPYCCTGTPDLARGLAGKERNGSSQLFSIAAPCISAGLRQTAEALRQFAESLRQFVGGLRQFALALRQFAESLRQIVFMLRVIAEAPFLSQNGFFLSSSAPYRRTTLQKGRVSTLAPQVYRSHL